MAGALYLGNKAFDGFVFYSGLVLGKTILMTPLTSYFRVRDKVFSTPEDVERFAPGVPVITNDPTVERVRSCHRNDLENVLPFTLIGLLYVTTDPDPDIALRCFRLYAASRMLHTAAYLLPLPQPARVLSFYVGWGTMAAMACFTFANIMSK